MVLADADQDTLNRNKAELSKTLTNKLQADTKNTNSKVEVKDVRKMSDGTLALDYECQDVNDQETAKKTLNQAVKNDDVKKTIVKSSKNDGTNAKPQQKVTNKPSEFLLSNIF